MPFLVTYAYVIIKVKTANKLVINYITRFRQCQTKGESIPEPSSFLVGGISESQLLIADNL